MKEISIEIIKSIKHLSREVMYYLFPGTLVIGYLLILLNVNGNHDVINFVNEKYQIITFIIVSYAFGHVIMGLVTCHNNIFMKSKKEEQKQKETLKNEIKIFENHPKLFYQYVDRYDHLYLRRKVLSVSFFIISFISFFVMMGLFIYPIQLLITIFNKNDLSVLIDKVYLISKDCSQNTSCTFSFLCFYLLTPILSFFFGIIMCFSSTKAKKDYRLRISVILKNKKDE